MNMVTFSAFEKQNCNILHFLHKLRTHAGYSSHASNGKILPTPLEKPLQETPARKPRDPRVNRPAAPASTAEKP